MRFLSRKKLKSVRKLKKTLLIGVFFLLNYGEAMEISIETNSKDRNEAGVLVVPCFDEDGVVTSSSQLYDFSSSLNFVLDLGDFKAKEKETCLFYSRDFLENRVLFLGLGVKSKLSKESLRRSVASAISSVLSKKITKVNFCSFKHDKFAEEEIVSLIAESALLTSYAFNHYKTKKDAQKASLESFTILASHAFTKEIKQVEKIVDAVNFARDLVNRNADDVTPKVLAEEAEKLDKQFSKVTTTTYDRKAFQKLGFGLLDAVSKSSPVEPYFIVVSYKGNPKDEDHTVLVGKGITYDTGGLSLKPTASMETMKCDMGGAAAVLGTVKALASLDYPINVTALVAATENSIGANSYKIGDVYTGYSGTTVEIKNTDAEGRLVLADALSYAEKNLKPSRMIDLATLTGAALVALGDWKSAFFSNNEEFAKEFFAAGERSGERVWRMPLDPDYKELISSKIADIKNSGSREGSLPFSAMFLQEFVGDVPWVHVDIAGPAFLDTPRDYNRSQATGCGIRLLFDYLTNLKTGI